MSPPPAILSGRKSAGAESPAWAFGGLLFLLALARLSVEWKLPLPLCGWKRLTGVPCPFCGGVRCFQASSCFAFLDGLRWNPLVFLGCVATALWFSIWIADRSFNRGWLPALRPWLHAPALKPLLIGAIVSNWIYLCLTLK